MKVEIPQEILTDILMLDAFINGRINMRKLDVPGNLLQQEMRLCETERMEYDIAERVIGIIRKRIGELYQVTDGDL